jgi:hypothetical protein
MDSQHDNVQGQECRQLSNRLGNLAGELVGVKIPGVANKKCAS